MNLLSHRCSQNTNRKLSRFLPSLHRAEILVIFCSYFGRSDDFINSFWNCLTFRRPRICINWNPPFQPSPHKISKNCFFEVNLTSQHSHLEVPLLSTFWSERISIDADSEPSIWCSSTCHQLFSGMAIPYIGVQKIRY